MSIRNQRFKKAAQLLFAAALAGYSSGALAQASTAVEDQTSSVNSISLAGGGTDVYTGAFTEAGSEIENDAILSYAVGGTDQDGIAASDPGQGGTATFLVDRVIDINVSRNGSTKTGTGSDSYVAFDVTNESNERLDVFLRAVVLNSGSSADTDLDGLDTVTNSELDLADVSIVGICHDSDGDNECGGGSDTDLVETGPGIYLLPDSLMSAISFSTRVAVQVDLGPSGETDDYVTIALAAALSDDSDGSGSRIAEDDNGNAAPDGTAVTGSALLDDPDVVENVFADAGDPNPVSNDLINFSTGTATDSDEERNGQHSARDQIQVQGADLVLAKRSEVIWDPIYGLKYPMVESGNGALPDTSTPVTEGPNAIPGAIVMYVITVQNDPDNTDEPAATAEDVEITDTLPTDILPGNNSTESDLSTCPTTGSGSGLAGSGALCAGGSSIDLDTRLDQYLIFQCGTVSSNTVTSYPDTTTFPAAAALPDDDGAVTGTLSGLEVGKDLDGAGPETTRGCEDSAGSPGEVAVIVFYATLP